MDEGKIAGIGTHEQLLRRNVYAALTQIVAVAVGERVYKLLRARLTRGKPKLFVGGVLISP